MINYSGKLMDRENRESYEYLRKVDDFDRELAKAITHDAEEFIREIFYYGLDFYEENDPEEEFNKKDTVIDYMNGVLEILENIRVDKYVNEQLKGEK